MHAGVYGSPSSWGPSLPKLGLASSVGVAHRAIAEAGLVLEPGLGSTAGLPLPFASVLDEDEGGGRNGAKEAGGGGNEAPSSQRSTNLRRRRLANAASSFLSCSLSSSSASSVAVLMASFMSRTRASCSSWACVCARGGVCVCVCACVCVPVCARARVCVCVLLACGLVGGGRDLRAGLLVRELCRRRGLLYCELHFDAGLDCRLSNKTVLLPRLVLLLDARHLGLLRLVERGGRVVRVEDLAFHRHVQVGVDARQAEQLEHAGALRPVPVGRGRRQIGELLDPCLKVVVPAVGRLFLVFKKPHGLPPATHRAGEGFAGRQFVGWK